MEIASIYSCSICLCTKLDGVYNQHAKKIFQDLFPELELYNPIFCCECSSMLDLYYNYQQILFGCQKQFKTNECNEMNYYGIIRWSNGDSDDQNNENSKCEVCSKITQLGETEIENLLLADLFPSLDSKFCCHVKLCKKCKTVLQNLKSFKRKCYIASSSLIKMNLKLELPQISNEENYSTNENTNSSEDTKVSPFVTTEQQTVNEIEVQNPVGNYKIYMMGLNKTELKPLRRNGVYLYNCPVCTKMVTNIDKHLKEHKEPFKKTSCSLLFVCDICDFQNESLDRISRHHCKKSRSKRRSSNHLFSCEICPFRSKQKGNLKIHMLVHKDPSEIKMYKCNRCKFQSRQKGNLKIHELIHKPPEKIKMHNCDYCSFQARQKGNLQTHILKKHTNLNKEILENVLHLKCKNCSFKTNRKKMLQEHMLVHNG